MVYCWLLFSQFSYGFISRDRNNWNDNLSISSTKDVLGPLSPNALSENSHSLISDIFGCLAEKRFQWLLFRSI